MIRIMFNKEFKNRFFVCTCMLCILLCACNKNSVGPNDIMVYKLNYTNDAIIYPLGEISDLQYINGNTTLLRPSPPF